MNYDNNLLKKLILLIMNDDKNDSSVKTRKITNNEKGQYFPIVGLKENTEQII